MQAYKMKGTIDSDGYLIIRSPIKMPPGEVEAIVVLEPVAAVSNTLMSATAAQAEIPKRQRPSQIKALKDWFEETEPASPDFDPDMARWEALKEKYNL
ncbi:MAG: hypothetical protein AB4352_14985 [Hormoscilla sp.]